MLIHAYRTKAPAPAIRAAPSGRDWMNRMPGKHPYRCLPLQIANSHGWELLCPYAIEVTWDGTSTKRGITIVSHGPPGSAFAKTKFGAGIVTFSHGIMFRTEEPYGLYVTGPINTGKDGIFPLTALAETNWLPAQIPMNWKFTRPGVSVRFEEGEPFCHVFPIAFTSIEDAEPMWRNIAAEPELLREFENWRCTRLFAKLDKNHSGTPSTFYRYYRRGQHANGQPAAGVHRTRLRVRQFLELASDCDVEAFRRSARAIAAAWRTLRAAPKSPSAQPE
jgi:hypothetical protein